MKYKIELCKNTPPAICHNIVGKEFPTYGAAQMRVNAIPSGIRIFLNIVPIESGA